MSAEHFQTFLSCDMKTAPDGRSALYAEKGKGEGKRWAESFGVDADPDARSGWATCYLYAHGAMEVCAQTVEIDEMAGLTGDHPEKRAQAAAMIRAVANAVRELALDDAFDGSMDDERWERALEEIRMSTLTPEQRTKMHDDSTESVYAEQRAAEKAVDQRASWRLDKVTETEGGWEISMDGGMCWHIRREYVVRAGIEPPKVDDEITLYPGGFGSMIHGADLNGVELFYTCDEERENARQASIRDREAEKKAKFAEQREEMDRQYDELPPPFQERIDIRRRNNPDFRWDFEYMEVYACRAAIQLAAWCTEQVQKDGKIFAEVEAFWADAEKLQLAAYPHNRAWERPEDDAVAVLYWWSALNSKAYAYDYKRQTKLVKHIELPDSGNSIGFTIMMTRLWLTSPADVPKPAGVLAPIVGSVKYGDCTQAEMDAMDAAEVG